VTGAAPRTSPTRPPHRGQRAHSTGRCQCAAADYRSAVRACYWERVLRGSTVTVCHGRLARDIPWCR